MILMSSRDDYQPPHQLLRCGEPSPSKRREEAGVSDPEDQPRTTEITGKDQGEEYG
jgi:hypothetical protein